MTDFVEQSLVEDVKSKDRFGLSVDEDKLHWVFYQNIKDSFRLLKRDVHIDNPKIKELLDYEEGVDQKIAFLDTPVGIVPGEAEILMAKIPPQDRKAGFDNVVLKLKEETGYLDEIDEVGLVSGLLNGLDNGKYGAFVKFLDSDSWLSKSFEKRNASGGYAGIIDTVLIPSQPPKPEDIWLYLATEGTLPRIVSILDHELIHDAQWDKTLRTTIIALASAQPVSLTVLLQKYGIVTAIWISNAIGFVSQKALRRVKNDPLLAEIHAFEGSSSSPTFGDEDLDSAHEIALHVSSAYNLSDRTFFDAVGAYNLIHSLRMFGLADQEIGRLVGKAKFEKKTRSYPVLEKALAKQAESWGIKDPFTLEDVKRVLLAKHELELRVKRHQAQKIAAKELQRETGRWFD